MASRTCSRFSLFVLALCAWTASAEASPGAAERETARSLMMDGDRLRAAGDLTSALSRFQSAHALMHVPTTGLAVAETQAQLGQLVEAHSTALEVTSLPVADAEPAVFTKAREAAAALASSLQSRVCTLKTHVLPANADYELQIDDVLLPTAARAVPFKTDPGAHTVRVRAPGFRAMTRVVNLREGAVEQIEIKLVEEPTHAEPERRAQAEPAALSDGQAAYSMQLQDAREGGRTRGLIGVSMGGAALAVGLVTGALSWKQTSDAKAFCRTDNSCDPSLASALQRANTLATVANVSVPLGVVGIAYGLYELLTLPAAPDTSQARAGVRIDVLPNGIILRGQL